MNRASVVVTRAMPMRTTAWTTLLVAIAVAGCSRSHDAPDAAGACCDAGPADAGADARLERDAAPDAPPPCVPSEELCNGADDDCDGTIDETPAELDCSVANGTAACEDGACAVAECDFGFADCDADPANGCEIETETDAASCGACGRACPEGVACHDGVCDNERIVAISAGEYHACAVRQSGEALCWGLNSSGQLGVGDDVERLVPTSVLSAGIFRSVATGSLSTCGVAIDGSVECWGDNVAGQLGDGSTELRLAPVASSTPAEVVTLSASPVRSGYVLAIDALGQVWGWGNNYYGQLGATGLGEPAIPTPFLVRSGPYIDAAAGPTYACALSLDGEVDCWGSVPGSLASALDALLLVDLEVGSRHACGLDGAGRVYCAGDNTTGAVGPFDCETCMTAQRVPLDEPAVDLSVTHLESCAVLERGDLFCWGSGLTDSRGAIPRRVIGLPSVVEMSIGLQRKCALDIRGAVWCWVGGTVGDGTTEMRSEPTQVVGLH